MRTKKKPTSRLMALLMTALLMLGLVTQTGFLGTTAKAADGDAYSNESVQVTVATAPTNGQIAVRYNPNGVPVFLGFQLNVNVAGIADTAAGTTITIPIDCESLDMSEDGKGVVPFFEYRPEDNTGLNSPIITNISYSATEVVITLDAVHVGDIQSFTLSFHLKDDFLWAINSTTGYSYIPVPQGEKAVLWDGVKANVVIPGGGNYTAKSGQITTLQSVGFGGTYSGAATTSTDVPYTLTGSFYPSQSGYPSNIPGYVNSPVTNIFYLPAGSILIDYTGWTIVSNDTNGIILTRPTTFTPTTSGIAVTLPTFKFPPDSEDGEVYNLRWDIQYTSKYSDREFTFTRNLSVTIKEKPVWAINAPAMGFVTGSNNASYVNQADPSSTTPQTRIGGQFWVDNTLKNIGQTPIENVKTVLMQPAGPKLANFNFFRISVFNEYSGKETAGRYILDVYVVDKDGNPKNGAYPYRYYGTAAGTLAVDNLSAAVNPALGEYIQKVEAIPDGYWWNDDPADAALGIHGTGDTARPVPPNGQPASIPAADDDQEGWMIPSTGYYLFYQAKSWPWDGMPGNLDARTWPDGTPYNGNEDNPIPLNGYVSYTDGDTDSGTYGETKTVPFSSPGGNAVLFYGDNWVGPHSTLVYTGAGNVLPGSISPFEVRWQYDNTNNVYGQARWYNPVIILQTAPWMKIVAPDGTVFTTNGTSAQTTAAPTAKLKILHEGEDYNLYSFTASGYATFASGNTSYLSIPVNFEILPTAPQGTQSGVLNRLLTTDPDASTPQSVAFNIRPTAPDPFTATWNGITLDRDFWQLDDPGQKAFREDGVNFNIAQVNNLTTDTSLSGDLTDGGAWTNSALTVDMSSGGDGKIKLQVINNGNSYVGNLLLWDILPHMGDTTLLTDTARDSAWTPTLLSMTSSVSDYYGNPVNLTLPVTTYYSTQSDPTLTYTPVGTSGTQTVHDGTSGAFSGTTTAPANMGTVKSFIYSLGNNRLGPGETLTIEMDFTSPVGVASGITAYNSFAYAASYYGVATGGNLLNNITPVEPAPRGLTIRQSNLGSVGDFVWLDLNGDGIQNPGEPGLNDVTAELYDSKDNLVETRTTGDNVAGMPGFYQFGNLDNGTYKVQFLIPASLTGYTFTVQNAGSDNTVNSKAGADGKTATFTVLTGQNITNIDAGVTTPNTGTINGHVYYDGTTTPISGVTVTLKQGAAIIGTVVTGQSGYYSFSNLATATNYTVSVTPLAGLTTVNPSSGTSGSLIINASNKTKTQDFTLSGTEYYSISGKLWIDSSQDQIIDTGEPAYAGIQIFAVSDNAIVGMTASDNLGNYSMGGLAAGTYDIVIPYNTLMYRCAALSADGLKGDNRGYQQTLSGISGLPDGDYLVIPGVVVSGSVTDQNAALWENATAMICGYVFIDVDGDGMYTEGIDTPLPNVDVSFQQLGEGNPIIVTSGADGMYVFSVLNEGTYTGTVDAASPELDGYKSTILGAGDNGNSLANLSDPTNIAIIRVKTYHFNIGVVPVDAGAVVSGTVWDDTNVDGMMTAGETGHAGVTVQLMKLGDNGRWDAATASVTTDADGYYEFAPVDPGAYQVWFKNPDSDNLQFMLTTGEDGRDTSVTTPNGHVPVTLTLSGATVNAGLAERLDVATVFFDYAGGTVASGTPSTSSYTTGLTGKPFNVPVPEKTGYTLTGWTVVPETGIALNKDSENPDTYSGTFGAAGSVTTYVAQWTAKPCSVSFYDSNPAATDPTAATTELTTGTALYDGTIGDAVTAETLTIPTPDPSKTGYVFVGWSDGTSTYSSATVLNYVISSESGVTFTAQYADTQNATVIFDYAGGTGTSQNYASGRSGTDFTAPANPEKTHYLFDGWQVSGSDNGTALDDSKNPATGTYGSAGTITTYVANWILDPDDPALSVTYDAGSATGTAPVDNTSYYAGDTVFVKAPTGLTYENHTFAGWLCSLDNEVYQAGESFPIPTEWKTTPITLTAQWNSDGQYTVTYNANGGTGTMTDANTYYTGTSVTLQMNTFTRANYSFAGWNTIADGSGKAYADGADLTMPAYNVVLYAQWMPNAPVPVTYAAGGGTGDVPIDNGVYYPGDEVTLKANTLTYANYTFGGWSDGTDTYLPGQVYTIPDSATSVTFTAVWNENLTYSVIYNGNGGTGSVTDENNPYHAGDPVTIQASNGFSRTNYTFVSWNTIADGSGDPYAAGDTMKMPAYNVVLYAQWMPAPNMVTYAADNASLNGDASESVLTGSSPMNVPGVSANLGYEFTGSWACSLGGTYTTAELGSYVVTGPVTFTAIVVPIANATVVFDYAGGTVGDDTSGSDSGLPDATFTAPVPTREGYTLTGWSPVLDEDSENPGTYTGTFGAAGSVTTYVAQWTLNEQYQVFYNSNGGSAAPTDSKAYFPGDTVTVLQSTDPVTLTNKVFAGWNDGTTTYQPGRTFTMPESNVTLTAVWTDVAQATVVFDYAGGTGNQDGTGATSSIQSGLPGEHYTAPDVYRTGYSLDTDNPWTTTVADDTFKTYGNPGSVVTYTANWVANSCPVSFYDSDPATNSRMGNAIRAAQVAYNTTIGNNVPADPTKTGYVFVGWQADEANGSGVYDSAVVANFVMNNVAGVTFTAVYADAQSAVVIFDYAGGIGDMPNYFIGKSGDPLTAPADPTRDGYDFDVWNPTPTAAFGDPGSVTVYTAQWTPKQYTVTFEQGNNGTLATNPTEVDATYGETITGIPTVTPNNGYTFIGWSNDGKLYGESAMAAYTVTGNVTFTAQYLPISQITVTFNYNGGTDTFGNSFITLQGYPDDALTVPADPTRTGYMFNSWDTTPAATFGDAASVYTAQWTPIPYTVTFDKGANGTMNPTTRSETVNYGATVMTVPTITANSSYTFLGWSMNGGSTYYSSADVAAMPITGTTNFVAMYQQTTITGGGGGGPVTPPVTPLVTPPVLTDEHIWYIRGYTDGTVRPNANITRAEAAMVLWRLTDDADKSAPVANAPQYSDMSSGDWFYQAVEYLSAHGIITGYTDGTFKPNQFITRAELAAMLSRFFNLPAGATQFPDVPSSYWASDAISRAAAAGWFVGYTDGTFRPENNTTRAEFVTAVNRVLNRKLATADINPSLNIYSDLPTTSWAYADIIEASYGHEYTRQTNNYETWTTVTGSGMDAAYNQ